jgi:TonB family protein
MEPGREKALRAGEFLQSAPLHPSGQFVTESETATSPDQSAAEPVDQLKELEPVSAPAPPPPPPPGRDEPRGLEWYLKKNGIQRGGPAGVAAAPAPAPSPAASSGPELLGFDQAPSFSPSKSAANEQPTPGSREIPKDPPLFSYITGDKNDTNEEETPDEPKTTSSSPARFHLGKGAMIAALGLAACAVIAAPQAPWHPQIKTVWAQGQRSLHAWLNPQATTVVTQAPASHEDFGRAGDEYKLPIAENIPDATTDPSQIQVVPVVDPTAKKPASDGTTPDLTTAPTDAPTTPATTTTTPAPNGSRPPSVQVQENPAAQPAPPAASPTTTAAPVVSAPASTGTAVVPVSNPPAHPDSSAVITTTPIPTAPASSTPPPPKRQPAQYVPVTAPRVPSSLQSQMAVMVPDASGNKPADAAMPAIEPVSVPELAERTLISDQPPMNYPASAKGQQGTVILQVLIGRDGTVQDAKFLQGSLAFARTAIDGVRQWKFKPYTMNGRPVSVQTTLTIKFKPAQ